MKRVGLTEAPVGKGKKRKAEKQHDADLLDAHSKHTAEKAKPRELEGSAKISGAVIRGVMGDTMARVYSEMWPAMKVRAGREGGVDAEIAEEAYILDLTMALGNTVDTPRRALNIRDAKISDDARFCEAHS